MKPLDQSHNSVHLYTDYHKQCKFYWYKANCKFTSFPHTCVFPNVLVWNWSNNKNSSNRPYSMLLLPMKFCLPAHSLPYISTKSGFSTFPLDNPHYQVQPLTASEPEDSLEWIGMDIPTARGARERKKAELDFCHARMYEHTLQNESKKHAKFKIY